MHRARRNENRFASYVCRAQGTMSEMQANSEEVNKGPVFESLAGVDEMVYRFLKLRSRPRRNDNAVLKTLHVVK